jgi:serine/threonine protein kinase
MLADFGLATRFRREWQVRVMAEHLQGTLAYLAPEQTGRIRRAADARADLCGLGVALYQL